MGWPMGVSDKGVRSEVSSETSGNNCGEMAAKTIRAAVPIPNRRWKPII
jgi:hypothetical protein